MGKAVIISAHVRVFVSVLCWGLRTGSVICDLTDGAVQSVLGILYRKRDDCPDRWRCADWIEHVLATKGEPYLTVPEDETSLTSRVLLGALASIAACGILLLSAWALVGLHLLCCDTFLIKPKCAAHRELPASDRAHQD